MDGSGDNILKRAVGGDTEALAALLREQGTAIRDALQISSQWQNVIDADDVMQVTYLEAFLRIRTFVPTGPNAFRAWLQRIADNNLRDAIKELQRVKRPQPNKRIRPPSDPDGSFELLDILAAGSSTPSRVARRNENRTALQAAIGRLPPDYRKAVQLYDMENRTIAEVAAQMGRSEGAVHMLRARHHDQLRDILGSESDFFSRGA